MKLYTETGGKKKICYFLVTPGSDFTGGKKQQHKKGESHL